MFHFVRSMLTGYFVALFWIFFKILFSDRHVNSYAVSTLPERNNKNNFEIILCESFAPGITSFMKKSIHGLQECTVQTDQQVFIQ